MLSPLSCRFLRLESSGSGEKLPSRRVKIDTFQSKILRLVSGKSSDNIRSNGNNRNNNNGPINRFDLNRLVSDSQVIIHILIVALFLIIFLIQGCISENRPCYCNGKYFPKCPPSHGCRPARFINRQPNLQKLITRPENPEIHDYEHPDHVLDDSLDSISRSDLFDDDFIKQPPPQPRDDLDVVDDDGRVVMHRKVYVSEKSNLDIDPIIHPLELKIPVSVDHNPPLPPPQPIFKMRKYTTYENKPEIVEVPVTTTIIKPTGVSKDQIIGEVASSLLAKEQIISNK